MSHAKKPTSIALAELLAERSIDGVRTVLRSAPPGETARLVTRLDRSEQQELMTLLPADEAAQLLKELSIPQAANWLGILSPERAAALIEHFPSNEQTDLLAELDDDAAPVFASLSAQTANRVRRLSQYGTLTAGGLMVAEFLVYPEHLCVSDVIDDLRARAQEYSRLDVQYAYVTDSSERLIGVLRLRDLLFFDRNDSVKKAMVPDPLRVRAETALEPQ